MTTIIKITKHREGPSSSPDGGAFWRKDGKIYWADGDITEDGGMMREMCLIIPESEWHKYENYSAWSVEKRAEVVARVKAEREQAQKEYDAEAERIKALCVSAKTKLTQEEYEAVQWSQFSYEQPRFCWDELP
jgi:hypothetical protein